jgi:hypothetical protein
VYILHAIFDTPPPIVEPILADLLRKPPPTVEYTSVALTPSPNAVDDLLVAADERPITLALTPVLILFKPTAILPVKVPLLNVGQPVVVRLQRATVGKKHEDIFKGNNIPCDVLDIPAT